jgi:flagellar protein FliS
MFAAQRNYTAAYRKVNVETGVTTADPHKLVAMLYDGALDSIAIARGALQRKDIPAKAQALSRAVRIVEEGLRGGLDRTAGGELASNLDGLYTYIVARLTHANLRNDDAALRECAELLTPLRDAWKLITPQKQAA